MLEKVKLALRISHNRLDNDINDTIKTATMEMIRVGISSQKANETTDPLIIQAIKTYCLFVYESDSKKIDGYFNSWQYQVNNLRNTKGYMAVSV